MNKLDQEIIDQLIEEGLSDSDLLKAKEVLLNLQLQNDNIMVQAKIEEVKEC